MISRLFMAWCMACVILAGCGDEDARPSVEGESIFIELAISGEENREDLSVLARVFLGGEGGRVIPLAEGDALLLDGQPLRRDSAGLSGVFYEPEQPLMMPGKHTFSLSREGETVLQHSFTIQPLALSSELPTVHSREALSLELQGGKAPGGILRLSLTDTAFRTDDVNQLVEAPAGTITITPAMWGRLRSGPIALELSSEAEKRVQSGGSTAARVVISQTLRRELELK